MKILGIDPGSRATGFALLEVDGGRTRYVESGVLPVPRSAPLAVRLAAIGSTLESLLRRASPDETAVEDLFHAVHARSALRLAHARGVILGVLARENVPISEYTPLQIKKAVSGYGLAGKGAMRSLIERLLSVPRGVLSSDASDAVAVALCHAQALPFRDAVRKADRREAGGSAPVPRARGRLARPPAGTLPPSARGDGALPPARCDAGLPSPRGDGGLPPARGGAGLPRRDGALPTPRRDAGLPTPRRDRAPVPLPPCVERTGSFADGAGARNRRRSVDRGSNAAPGDAGARRRGPGRPEGSA